MVPSLVPHCPPIPLRLQPSIRDDFKHDFFSATTSNSATTTSNDVIFRRKLAPMEGNFPNIFTDGYDTRPNNQPISVVENATELMLLFYIRHVILTHEESPPRQQIPPIVALPPRRKKYKSETSSTESATNAYSSQHPEVERTYMSSDTSIRSVKKKKTSTKALVKRLLGVMAELFSKVDRVLQKKDEPYTGFGEEEDMVNEEEEETDYHGTQLDYDDISTHGLEGEVGRTPTNVEPSPDMGEHQKKTVTPIVRPQRKRGVPWY
ncbi:unnamed protein product [Lactuca virosa]|uniref:DET1- and DDB1-associated protein 1 n=1 Tax=Lactuca virosa TaxID=75947 RepID=A0AAU9PRK0_9ASTR|nr:unnamed protein product [Lactuca virosa]